MTWPGRVTVLCGGVGGSRFVRGLAGVLKANRITAVVNTGDDIVLHGLHISPDVDIVLYSMAGIVDKKKGWGISGDSFRCLKAMERLGMETWFKLGDLDLATHVYRTDLLNRGLSLSEVTRRIAKSLGVKIRVIPMTDDRFETHIRTPRGLLHFQEYLVKGEMRDRVLRIEFVGGSRARPAPGVLDSISRSELVVFGPSNPFVSIGTVLSVRGVKKALRAREGPTVGISPIIGGKVVKGPLARMMASMGLKVSSASVAMLYRGLLDGFVIDRSDAHLADRLRRMGMVPLITDILIADIRSGRRLAKEIIKFGKELSRRS